MSNFIVATLDPQALRAMRTQTQAEVDSKTLNQSRYDIPPMERYEARGHHAEAH